jgi:DNA-3-methyladenine glycosylase
LKNLDFLNSDVVQLSQDLLGYQLCTRIDGLQTTGIIVETEAYRGPEDKASHAYKDRRTNRTEVIFQKGGISYVYLCYGIHHLFNVVSGPAETAHAILVRALEPRMGLDVMRMRRGDTIPDKQLTNGPGKLCQALGITREQNGLDLDKDSKNGIWIEEGIDITSTQIIHAKRVGVDYADEWKEKLWRFYIKDNPYVSVW